jgi:hypothetical protein
VEDLRVYKKECLLAEHAVLSGYVDQELVATSLLRGFAAAAWLIAVPTALAAGAAKLVVLLAVGAFMLALWLSDVWVSYVGVVYKMRRLKVRTWIDELPHTSDQTVEGWKTPVNPFDGLTRGEKTQALRDALASPAVLLVYLLLEVTTWVLLAL